jgi:hypothetical protein
MNIQQSTPTTPLRARMIADMSGRNLGPASQTSHLRACKRFAAWLAFAAAMLILFVAVARTLLIAPDSSTYGPPQDILDFDHG